MEVAWEHRHGTSGRGPWLRLGVGRSMANPILPSLFLRGAAFHGQPARSLTGPPQNERGQRVRGLHPRRDSCALRGGENPRRHPQEDIHHESFSVRRHRQSVRLSEGCGWHFSCAVAYHSSLSFRHLHRHSDLHSLKGTDHWSFQPPLMRRWTSYWNV